MNIVVALPCEARPIIRHFQLEQVPNCEFFPLYQNKNITLIVSGVGRIAVAAAVGFLQMYKGNARNDPWLNIGIGGHSTLDVGTLVSAHKISDFTSRQTGYPTFTFETSFKKYQMITVEHEECEYPQDAVYEMEAMGFFAAAARFSTAELIHVLKIISDNRLCSTEKINSKFVEELISKQMNQIELFVNALQGEANKINHLYQNPPQFASLVQGFHFTVTQQHQLKRLLKRWNVLRPGEELSVNHLKNAKSILNYLEEELNKIPVSLRA